MQIVHMCMRFASVLVNQAMQIKKHMKIYSLKLWQQQILQSNAGHFAIISII